MNAAKKSDRYTTDLPTAKSTIVLNRTFSTSEIQRIREGLVPHQMEDKWFIYWHDDALYFHRSWTGNCIYKVRFIAEDGCYRMIEADVNRDPKQYRETRNQHDAKMISYLIDTLLLQQEAVFPSDEPDPEKDALMQWSQIGRAMFGQHPRA